VFHCAACGQPKTGKARRELVEIRLVAYPGTVSGHRADHSPTTPWGHDVRGMQSHDRDAQPLGYEAVKEGNFCRDCRTPYPKIVNRDDSKKILPRGASFQVERPTPNRRYSGPN
jgi:hypothetical protein